MKTGFHSKPNPFSTRFVRPGAIEYRLHDGRSLDELVDDFFDRDRGCSSIVGPHGSGKSTLLASLQTRLAERVKVFAYRFSTTDRNFASMWSEFPSWGRNRVIVVDGYEQLSVWMRWRLRVSVRRRGANLLITAHQAVRGLPVLWRTEVDEELAIQLRNGLLASHPELLTTAGIEDAWREARKAFPSDLRETLMSMYDWAEVEKQKRLASHDNSRAV